ncbi:MAG: CdaR family protein [Kiritimatiellae bacterium]|nr:CdaR family protein [Kiritimatiellia bacterium]
MPIVLDKSKRDRLLNALRNNGRVKLLALVVAIGTWYAIRAITSFTTVVRNVPVEVMTEKGVAILDRSVDMVNVVCRGSQSDIRTLSPDQIKITIELKDSNLIGSREVPLELKKIRVPGGARAVSVEPPTITLVLDKEGTRTVNVRADITTNNLPDGFEVSSIICDPEVVTLQGPRGRLADVEEVKTAPIDLEGRTRTFSLNRTIQPPSDLWSARVEPDRVRVDVEIVPISSALELADVKVRLLVNPETPPVRSLSKKLNVQVKLRGRADTVKSLSVSNMTGYVDCSMLTSGTKTNLPIFVPVPSGVDIVSIEPSHIPVEIP